MPKRIKQSTRPKYINQLTHYLANVSTQENNGAVLAPSKAQVSLLMAEMGRKGGKIGGKRRLKTMTAQQRKKVARKAARARWSKRPKF